MRIRVKELKNMSCEELLQIAKEINKDGLVCLCSNSMVMDRKSKAFQKAKKFAYMRAVKKASCKEQLEECAVAIEENYCGHDADEWAEQIRIKAYGMEWYLSEYFSSPAYEEFVSFANVMGIPNPFA